MRYRLINKNFPVWEIDEFILPDIDLQTVKTYDQGYVSSSSHLRQQCKPALDQNCSKTVKHWPLFPGGMIAWEILVAIWGLKEALRRRSLTVQNKSWPIGMLFVALSHSRYQSLA